MLRNTDKELKKNKFGTANQAGTVQPKSMDGLQNHADTQKLTQFKTAAEQSNRHEKLTQFKTAAEQSNRHEKLTQFKTAAEQSNRHEKLTQLQSMGDARAHEIQNGGVVQLMWPAAGRVAAMGAGAAARAARGPLVAKVLTGLAGMQAVATLADNGSGLAFGVLMKDKKKIFEGSVGLLEPAISKMGLPDGVPESAQTYLKTLIKFSESVEYGDSTDDSAFQRIGEDFRVFSKALDAKFSFNPAATVVAIDNVISRAETLIELVKGNKEFIKMHDADSERDRNAASAATAATFDKDNPELAALHKQDKYSVEGVKYSKEGRKDDPFVEDIDPYS
jgi:hypothetical protein